MMFRHILNDGGHRMLFVGDIVLKPASKFTKEGNSFTLKGVTQRNAGKYACRIETDPVTELVHTLDVLYPASVYPKSPSVQKVVQGDSVTLECEAEGNPPAQITWTRRQGHLPSGAQSEKGLSIIINDVDRHVEGDYVCTASNGIGEPSSAAMTIEVEYEPEIIAEQTLVHSGEGDQAKLLCIVHGRPAPSVTWMKEGQPVREDTHIQEHDAQHRHTLTIKHVQAEDFGDYKCIAENERGSAEHTLRLTGIAKTPRMTSSPAGGEDDAYTITWETETYTPILQYRLRYRKSRDPGGWDDHLYTPGPTEDIASGRLHHMSHAIEDLEPATDYEAEVAVENKFGWSDSSEIFQFYTRKEEPSTTTTTSTTTTPPPTTTTTTTDTSTTLAPEPENIAPLTEEKAVGHSASGSGRLGISAVTVLMVLLAAAILS
ncbi:neural cell adhesion molecule 2-like isoform X2 [Macrobrachium nipponense]|uniref:neural cell adhesion molecule 2-like isoform X2 n=1 Tax=Macrobrachium nipponense TaxID=159736 RepID=UPI0030C89FA2